MERKTKVFKELKEVWEASDGTTFFKQEECEKYEHSEMGIVWQRFKALPKTILDNELLGFYEEENVFIKMAMTDEAKKVMAHLCTACYATTTIEKILAVPDGAEAVFDMRFCKYNVPIPEVDVILCIGTMEEVRQKVEHWLSDEFQQKRIKEATGENGTSSNALTMLQMMGILK